ncbi:MAG: ABC transporter ATP-binding protein [Deltaproteobacteria bacterium]|nr:ABC transporter ATP-binding protein [Deltaproteobacteria bacterium]MBW2120890.1 ABC transporter ATP-binding protein [Deltaproteobacteria bacterium]
MEKLRLENVYKYYRGKDIEAVKDLSLSCKEGECLAFLGPSGCGKTSTLRMIAGLEKISRGSIYIGETRVNDLPPQRRNIAMAFEDYALYPPLTVFENIAFPLQAKGIPAREIKKRVKRVAEVLRIDEVLEKTPAELSGGQQQRISLARALVKEGVELILMDEPISHLDTTLKNEIRTEIKRLHLEVGNTIVYVTHDQLEAMALGDRIAVMNLGVLQQVGRPDELYDKPANLFVAGFIGEPPMNFIDCTVSQQGDELYLESPLFRLPLSPEEAVRFRGSNKRMVTIGIRPGDLEPGRKDGPGFVSIRGSVYAVELVGDMTVVYLRSGEHRLLLTLLGAVDLGKREDFVASFSTDHVHVFDKESGKALASA